MYLAEAVGDYMSSLAKRGQSENTMRSAWQALRLIVPELDTHYNLDWITTDLLEDALASRDLAPASFNRYRSALVGFFNYCLVKGWCSSNPAVGLHGRRVIDKPNLILSLEQMLAMLDGANPVERIALALGMNTGLRASDIVSLKVGDVDLSKLTLKVWIQKTGGYDEKPITRQLADELVRWYSVYGAMTTFDRDAISHGWHLVPSYTHTTLGQLILRPHSPLTHPHRIVQRALKRLDLPTEGEGFHTLRRSAARVLFEKLRADSSKNLTGYDHALMVVKEFLNHKSTDQTQRYLGVNHERQIRDDMLRGKDFLLSAPNTAALVQGINASLGISHDNPDRVF